MKDKLSKIKSVIKKYGVVMTVKKVLSYIISKFINFFNSISFFSNKKSFNKFNYILNDSKFEIIIIWKGSFGWNVPLYQRPQHMAQSLSKNNCLVLYEVNRFTDKVNNIKKVNDNLFLVNFENKAINKMIFNNLEKYKGNKYIQIYSTDWMMTLNQMKQYIRKGYKIIYEYIDEINPILSGTKEVPINIKEKYEYILKDKENVFVIVTADRLKEDIIQKRGSENLAFVCNGVDYEYYQNIDEKFKFSEQFQHILDEGKPIIGYYGALASWFDYELIKKLAIKKPNYNIVLIGTKYDDSYANAGLDKITNIHYLGTINYMVLKNYASKFDVCIIPFIINDITKATSPLKIFEYMALGKPIVTTPMDECKKYKSVFIVNNIDSFIDKIKYTLTLNKNKDKDYFTMLNKEALENTWDSKAKKIIETIKAKE